MSHYGVFNRQRGTKLRRSVRGSTMEPIGNGEQRIIMETLTIQAIYEDGKLTPLTPLPCHDKEQVLLKVVRQSNVDMSQGLIKGLDPETIQNVAESSEFSVLD